jgi:hypothetical protein
MGADCSVSFGIEAHSWNPNQTQPKTRYAIDRQFLIVVHHIKQ